MVGDLLQPEERAAVARSRVMRRTRAMAAKTEEGRAYISKK